MLFGSQRVMEGADMQGTDHSDMKYNRLLKSTKRERGREKDRVQVREETELRKGKCRCAFVSWRTEKLDSKARTPP